MCIIKNQHKIILLNGIQVMVFCCCEMKLAAGLDDVSVGLKPVRFVEGKCKKWQQQQGDEMMKPHDVVCSLK